MSDPQPRGGRAVKSAILSCGIFAALKWALGSAAHHLEPEHIDGIVTFGAAAGSKILESVEHLFGHVAAEPVVEAVFPHHTEEHSASGLNHDIERALARTAARSISILIGEWRSLHSKDRILDAAEWELDGLVSACTAFLAEKGHSLPPKAVAEWLDALAAAKFFERPELGAAPWNDTPAGPAPAPPCSFAAWFDWRYPAVFQHEFSEELLHDAAARHKFNAIVSRRILDYSAHNAAQLGAIKAQLDTFAGRLERDDKSLFVEFEQRARQHLSESLAAQTADIATLIRQSEERVLDALAAPLPITPLHQLPPWPDGFVGREADLIKLRAVNPATGALITGLKGMGGIGKTALALVLAHEWAARFPDAQLFLDARGTQADPPSATKLMEQVVHAFHPTAKLPDDAAAIAGIYRNVLSGKKVLILLDNALNAAQVAPLIPSAGCALIVTSRQTFDIPAATIQSVGRLEDGEAAELLCVRYKGLAADELAELVELCAGLALALRLAESHIYLDAVERDGKADVAAYVAALRKARLNTLDRDAEATAYATISETLRLSEAQLSETEGEAWRRLGVFTSSFDARAAQAVAGADATMLGHFVRRSMLERVGADRYRLHDLAAEYARKKLDGPTLFVVRLNHVAHFYEVGCKSTELYRGGKPVEGLALFDRERAQIEAAFSWLATIVVPHFGAIGSDSSRGADVSASTRIEALEISKHAATMLIELISAVVHVGLALRFHPRQQIEWYEVELGAARLSANRRAEGWALGNLGIAHGDLGDARKALDFHEQALTIAREIGVREDEGNTLGHLGNAHTDLGDTRKAIEFHEQRLAIAREIGDRRGEGFGLNCLGVAHYYLGYVCQAIEFHERAVVVFREIGDRREEGNGLNNLGHCYLSLGNARKAIEYLEQRLGIACEIGDRHGKGSALGNLGNALVALGEARKAIEFHEQALVVFHEIGDRREEGIVLGNLGSAHIALGETRKAVVFYEQRLVIAREIGDRRGEGNALWNSALANDSLGNRAEAIARAAAALVIREAIEDPNAAKVRAKLAEWRGE